MGQWVSKTDIKTARRVCLYDFLLSEHPGDVEQEGDSLRLRCNHSVSIKSGYAGFTDFSSGDTGNAIECLTNYFDYEFPDAVTALCEFDRSHRSLRTCQNAPGVPQMLQADKVFTSAVSRPQAPQRGFIPPEPVQGPYRQLYAYLTQQRGIPPALVQMLINNGILYQEKEHNNLVFINPSRTFAELRGSNSTKSFHRVMFADVDTFWWFKMHGDSEAKIGYVCEGAIDAISLFCLHLAGQADPPGQNALYCGIGGVANQQRINRIKTYASNIGGQIVIAVDNDQAGAECRQRNPDCKVLIPHRKDWNEDLIKFQSHR